MENMIKSSEFIKGYTEIIVCALLYKNDDYIYNLVKTITSQNNGIIQITNPSLLIIMKKMLADGKIQSYIKEGTLGADRKYYALTELGRKYYLENYKFYLNSLDTLKSLICGGNFDAQQN